MNNALLARDIWGGILIAVTGFAMVFYCVNTLDTGTLNRMGPGMFPAGVGAALTIFGVLIAIAGWGTRERFEQANFRSIICVLSSIAAFALLIRPLGLLPAIAATILISLLAERPYRPIAAMALILFMSAISYVVFRLVLGLPLQMVRF